MTAPTAERRLDGLVMGFRQAFPLYVLAWNKYPDIGYELDEMTDTVACKSMSHLFVDYCRARGIEARIMHGQDADDSCPMLDDHYWVKVRLGGSAFAVDWTARQFHNLDHPPSPKHADLSCPLIWQDPEHHPLVDFLSVTTVLR